VTREGLFFNNCVSNNSSSGVSVVLVMVVVVFPSLFKSVVNMGGGSVLVVFGVVGIDKSFTNCSDGVDP